MSILDDYPEDVFEHLAAVLQFAEPVDTSGRGGRRTWYLGNPEIDGDNRLLIGQIGWEREEPQQRTRFDREKRSWIHDVESASQGNDAPFVFDGDTGRLAVLQHESFRPQTVAVVFTTLLNRGERLRSPNPAVDWEVEPLLDPATFHEWLERTRSVLTVTFVAKLPNPDAMEEFEGVLRRLEERKAAALRETWQAADPDLGLQNIEEDQDARQILAMAERGYGRVLARGIADSGRTTRFNQRQTVRREVTPPLPSSWAEMIGVFIDFALAQMRRRDGGES